jgi:hypothetical protein
MENKYTVLGGNFFGFELFEEIIKTINKQVQPENETMFNNGLASAEAAVRRLREEYYEAISKSVMDI